MSHRHFFNDAKDLVLDALEGVVLSNPDLALDRSQKVIFLKPHDPSSHTALISGGGAGHEPAHAAYVGQNMLTAAVSGNIFASPNVSQIVSAMSRVSGTAGTILIIKNYTGDVFHFHLAAEKARAMTHTSKIHVLVVGDDVSVGRKRSGKVGRRGLAGTVLVHKVLGAMSKEAGIKFEALVEMGELLAASLVTVGASLAHVHIPGQQASSDSTPDQDQIELGMGIHNEPGCKVLTPQPTLPDLIDMMLDQLLNMDDEDRAYVDFSTAEEIVLLVNNLGGTSVLELSAITKHVYRNLESRGIKISRLLSGTYMTSLDGPGFSITLLKATPYMIKSIDVPVAASGWSAAVSPLAWSQQASTGTSSTPAPEEAQIKSKDFSKMDVEKFRNAVTVACNNLIEAEPRITHADTLVGDGDCGTTLARGAAATLEFLSTSSVSPDAGLTILHLANVIEEHMDGTSGAIYSIFFTALASAVRSMPLRSDTLGIKEWSEAASTALKTLQRATPARKGDRTLMDAVEPFVEALASGKGLSGAVECSRAGVAATKGMTPAFGRAVYVEENGWNRVGDPGAEGVLCILNGLASVLG